MAKPKVSTIVLILLLLASNVFWFYKLIDQGVTQMYSDSSVEYAESNYSQLVVLSNLNIVGKSAAEVMLLLPKDIKGLDPFIKGGCLYYSQVCIRLNSNNIVEGFGGNAL